MSVASGGAPRGDEPRGTAGSVPEPATDGQPVSADPAQALAAGQSVSTSPGGAPTGNPLDPLARPGVDVSDAPHTGLTAPPRDEVAPHDAVLTPEQRRAAQAAQADAAAGDAGAAGPSAQDGAGDVDPDPGDTPGLESGGGVAPGDTPPASGGTQTSLARDENLPGGRTRLLIPISIVVVLALLVAAFFIGQFL